ncbi:3'-5' exonuclease [Christiangramia fulva]|uniref:3'-5' exonuclease n=1 Tax=Christiangramia fulva TaxID=2126553 RepID=A0A2R3Z964_9FLAO|nr:3'-5' exonuclease [Christiangramia fulva]AVR46754.1 3'-5' exonuclease [Christiangramia fulva]
MILNWFKKKDQPENLPDFWKKYARLFQQEIPENIQDITYIVFDTETTGFDFENDRILCIGAVTVEKQAIEINRNFEIYLEQEIFNPETVKIHGIIKSEKTEKLSEIEALKKFLKYIGNSVLVAHHANFDIKMINKALERHDLPKLKNKYLDTALLYKRTRILTNLIDREKVYTLDEIAEAYNIDLSDRHTALGDAYITAIIFIKILARISKSKKMNSKNLFRYRL